MTDELKAVELQLSFLSSGIFIWQQGPVIGTGRFGQVYLALRAPSAEFIAVKQIFVQEEFDHGNDTSTLCLQRMLPLDKIEREIEIVQSINHRNIVHFYGCERSGSLYNIFMEYIPSGSVNKVLKEFGPFRESIIRSFIRQVSLGIAYLHGLGIAHRDLKCANLLLADDGTVKIADFGTAKRVCNANDESIAQHDEYLSAQDTARSVREGLGSPYWMAPEIVRAQRGDDGWRKADIWGIGCIMIELATGKPPWENHSNPLTAMFHIASKDAIPTFPQNFSECANSFLMACFDKNPSTRASATELLRHPFLQGNADTNEQVADLISKTQIQEQQSSLSPPCSSRSGSDEFSSNRSRSSSYGSSVSYSSNEHDDEEPPMTASITGEISQLPLRELGRVRVLADYHASDVNEMSLVEGDVYNLFDVNDYGWWCGRSEENSSECGWFPCTYVSWIPTDKRYTVTKPFESSYGGRDGLLDVFVGDEVVISQCEWRNDCLWAYGTCHHKVSEVVSSGWFPFNCVVNFKPT